MRGTLQIHPPPADTVPLFSPKAQFAQKQHTIKHKKRRVNQQITKHKSQIRTKLSKFQFSKRLPSVVLVIGALDLEFVRDLLFVIWCLFVIFCMKAGSDRKQLLGYFRKFACIVECHLPRRARRIAAGRFYCVHRNQVITAL